MHLRCLSYCIISAAASLTPIAATADAEFVLELFTSQGCYSCPPADKLLAEKYADQPGLLALEMHVDYWDELIYGSAGKWKDPYSDNRYTRRQRAYAAALGQRTIFTPQAVVQGATGLSGTDERQIDAQLERLEGVALPLGWDVQFVQDGKDWKATIVGGEGAAEGYVVVFLHHATTRITGGENNGKTLDNRNIAVGFKQLGTIEDGDSLQIDSVSSDQGCAVILQRPGHGVILGAWRCPTQTTG